ncbi:MAG: hypothetical protein CENE_00821 [Candidatus Celerinatantimonas neptuna]|nr:MAG: hypothetical protein CENE_00821 [Candidatus Celerinatantimonas neptuna]
MRKSTLAITLAAGTLFSTSGFAADSHYNNSLNVQVNNDSVAVGASAMAAPNFNLYANGQYSSDNGTLAQVGGEFVKNNGAFSFGFGAKAIALMAKHRKDGGVVALGGHAEYQLNELMGVGAEVYYSPDILSFHHIDRYLSYGAHATYAVLDNVDVKAGWRRTSFGYSAQKSLHYENNFYLESDYKF